MKRLLICTLVLLAGQVLAGPESAADRDSRMQWWREARFGLFIHWGLYAVPAGEWGGKTDYAEWIRENARIPVKEYEKFVARFNPGRFDPDAWVRMAKAAGMKYIVITTKHHDGFCLFDAKETEFSVMATPFHRDVMKALAAACRKQGMKICWYYSIMDWHHPDYLPRRSWETDRPDSGADFSRYIRYMKAELRELLTQYGPIGVLWFDGEWESTWTTAEGRDLYDYVRSLQPGIIINNRVGAARSGMEGFTKEGEFAGDFGTPEQEVPATGLPGVDWETCMTMNDHWGYNSHDANWKSSKELIRTLADVASKGGNFLLNIGPTADGVFPAPAVERLKDLGEWMRTHGESITGTTASPFRSLPWGRCTSRRTASGTTLYLHVFDWPAGGTLTVPGLLSDPEKAYVLGGDGTRLPLGRSDDALLVTLPPASPDSCDAVVALEIAGPPDIGTPPLITAAGKIFIDSIKFTITSAMRNTVLRYTTDGSEPDARSRQAEGEIRFTESGTVSARGFRDGKPVSPVSRSVFTKVAPLPAQDAPGLAPGIAFRYYQGEWDTIPDFESMTPVKGGSLGNFAISSPRAENYGFMFEGFIAVPARGIYTFFTGSDDGSRLIVDGRPIVENNGLHGMTEKQGAVALEKGLHALRIAYFNKTGGSGLEVSWSGPGFTKCRVPDGALFFRR